MAQLNPPATTTAIPGIHSRSLDLSSRIDAVNNRVSNILARLRDQPPQLGQGGIAEKAKPALARAIQEFHDGLSLLESQVEELENVI